MNGKTLPCSPGALFTKFHMGPKEALPMVLTQGPSEAPDSPHPHQEPPGPGWGLQPGVHAQPESGPALLSGQASASTGTSRGAGGALQEERALPPTQLCSQGGVLARWLVPSSKV